MKRNTFSEYVKDTVRQIPKGQTRSYGEVAKKVGHPGAARAVGTVMKNNHDLSVPCHRVICANGSLGEYNRGRKLKYEILKKEGAI